MLDIETKSFSLFNQARLRPRHTQKVRLRAYAHKKTGLSTGYLCLSYCWMGRKERIDIHIILMP